MSKKVKDLQNTFNQADYPRKIRSDGTILEDGLKELVTYMESGVPEHRRIILSMVSGGNWNLTTTYLSALINTVERLMNLILLGRRITIQNLVQTLGIMTERLSVNQLK